jgi:hypothetical protein
VNSPSQGILERLNGTDPGDVQSAMAEYLALVDRFYKVCEHLVWHQYEAAKQDFEYFMKLLDLAYHYYEEKFVETNRTGNQDSRNHD